MKIKTGEEIGMYAFEEAVFKSLTRAEESLDFFAENLQVSEKDKKDIEELSFSLSMFSFKVRNVLQDIKKRNNG